MNRRKMYNLFILSSIVLLLVVFTIIDVNKYALRKVRFDQEVSYVDESTNYYNHYEVYLKNTNNYLTRVVVELQPINDEVQIVNNLFDCLKKDQVIQTLPSNFIPLIPSNISILDLRIDNKILYLNLSKEFLEMPVEDEELSLQSLVYTFTSLDFIDNIQLQVDGKVINKLPKSNTFIPTVLDRSYGINTIMETNDLLNADKVILYYCLDSNEKEVFYVPVLKYVNNLDDKITYIVNELSNDLSMDSNLKSYLGFGVYLERYTLENGDLNLYFNEQDFLENTSYIPDEAIRSLVLSLTELPEVRNVSVYVGDSVLFEKMNRPLD